MIELTEEEKQLILDRRKGIQIAQKPMSEIVNDILPDIKKIYNEIAKTKNFDNTCKEEIEFSLKMLVFAIRGNIVRHEYNALENKAKTRKAKNLSKQISKALCINLEQKQPYPLGYGINKNRRG